MMRPPGTYVLPGIHPARFFRDATLAFTGVEGWRKAVRIQRGGPTRIPPALEDWQWRPTVANVVDWFAALRGPAVVDFEATVQGQPVCMAAWSCERPTERRGICVPFLSQGGVSYWHSRDESKVMNVVVDFLTDPSRPKGGHNVVGYDLGYPPWNAQALVKRAWGINAAGVTFDTMAMHHVAFAELRHSLAFCASIATDLGPFKITVHESDATDTDKSANEWLGILDRDDRVLRWYCLLDAFSTVLVYLGLADELADYAEAA